jgi:hypothetical protein
MRSILAAAFLAFLALGCGEADKFSGMRPDEGAFVEIPGWPALPAGVAGYNLYMAKKAEGPWEKVNDAPITGGRTRINHLDDGLEYCFRLTSVTSSGLEGKPSAVFKKKAAAPKK